MFGSFLNPCFDRFLHLAFFGCCVYCLVFVDYKLVFLLFAEGWCNISFLRFLFGALNFLARMLFRCLFTLISYRFWVLLRGRVLGFANWFDFAGLLGTVFFPVRFGFLGAFSV